MSAATGPIDDRTFQRNLGITRRPTVATGVTVHDNWCVCLDSSGNVVNGTTSRPVGGIVMQGKTAGEKVELLYNHVQKFICAGVDATCIGTTAYLADNQTATLTPNTAILGQIVDWEDGAIYVHMTLETVE